MFSKKATKIDEIFTYDLTLCRRQIEAGINSLGQKGYQLSGRNVHDYIHQTQFFLSVLPGLRSEKVNRKIFDQINV